MVLVDIRCVYFLGDENQNSRDILIQLRSESKKFQITILVENTKNSHSNLVAASHFWLRRVKRAHHPPTCTQNAGHKLESGPPSCDNM